MPLGVATSAFYPSVMLGGALGVESLGVGSLINASSLLWSLGVSAVATVFDGGASTLAGGGAAAP